MTIGNLSRLSRVESRSWFCSRLDSIRYLPAGKPNANGPALNMAHSTVLASVSKVKETSDQQMSNYIHVPHSDH